MLKSVTMVAAILAVAATPALAGASCGSAPIAPAIPTVGDIGGKTVDDARAVVIDAYHQVKSYQATLKPYRDCLMAQNDSDKAALADAQGKADKDKVASLKQEIADLVAAYDKTIDTETQVATDFNALHTAQCVKDTDPKICPKKK